MFDVKGHTFKEGNSLILFFFYFAPSHEDMRTPLIKEKNLILYPVIRAVGD